MRVSDTGIRISEISNSVCPLTMSRVHEGTVVGTARGSGFFWRTSNQWYVLTNWHNVTGMNADTGKLMGSFIPNKLMYTARCFVRTDGNLRIVQAYNHEIDLYENDSPIWIEHPLRRQIDCVAIPILPSVDPPFAQRALNEGDFQDDLLPTVGMDCFIVGYPLALAGRVATPIWKRGSIATEPELDHDKLPLLLVDAATRKGMSGSPVVFQHHGVHMPQGELTDDTVFGTVQNLLGIYSGRIDDDPMGAQLGRVWKARVINELFESGVRGIHPNEI